MQILSIWTILRIKKMVKTLTIGEGIRARRKALHMTQKELSEELSITEDEMSQIEEGNMQPSLELLEALNLNVSNFV